MKYIPRLIVCLTCCLSLAFITLTIFPLPATFAQTQENVVVRSRAERVAGRRKTEATFPEVTRALRLLRLRGKKLNDAQNIVQRYETETRSSREELQLLLSEAPREDFARGHSESPRATQIQATLQQATDNLHAEIRTLLTPQQRDQFEQHLQKQTLHKDISKRRSH